MFANSQFLRATRVHDELRQRRDLGYTTVLKLLQIMTEKGLVARDTSNRSHVYEATASQEKTQSQLVGHLMDKAFGGSARTLVLRALAAKPADPEELAEIRRLIREIEDRA